MARRRAYPTTRAAGWSPSPRAGCWTRLRSEQSRRRREDAVGVATPHSELLGRAADAEPGRAGRLAGPAVPVLPPGAVRAQPDRADAARGRRPDHRADRRGVPGARGDDGPADQPGQADHPGRRDRLSCRPAQSPSGCAAVLHVLYLIFNEGYTATTGRTHRARLSDEAIRLTRWLHRLLPDDGEVAGLLALMLLTDARRPARTRPDGSLVPLAEQDRGRWDRSRSPRGSALISEALPARRPSARTSCRPPSPPSTTRPPTRTAPTGRRSSACTSCWNRSSRIPWSPSTVRSPSPWSTGPQPRWTCSPRWSPTPGSRATTGSTRPAPTCWSWPATTRCRGGRLPRGRPANHQPARTPPAHHPRRGTRSAVIYRWPVCLVSAVRKSVSRVGPSNSLPAMALC